MYQYVYLVFDDVGFPVDFKGIYFCCHERK